MIKKLAGFLLFTLILLSLAFPALAVTETDFWAALEKGDYQTAANAGKELGSLTPEYYLLAAICYQNLSQYQLAEISRLQFEKKGDPVKLRDIIINEQSLSQDHPQVLLLEGMVAVSFPEIKLGEASDFLSKIGKRLSENPYLYNYLALQSIINRDYSVTAQKQLQKAIALKKDYPEPYLNLATVLIQNKATEKAIELLLDCLKNCPLVPLNAYESLINLTCSPVTIKIKPFGEEITTTAPGFKDQYRLKIKSELQPVPYHLLGLAEYFILKGNPVTASELLTDYSSDSGIYTYLQLKIANLKGDQAQITAYGNALLAKNDLDYRRLVEAGNIFFYNKDFKMAESFYLAALSMANPEDSAYLNKINSNLGTGYYLAQDYQKALLHLGKALSYEEDDPVSLVNLGLTYRDLGDKPKAIEAFNRSLEYIRDPEWRQEVNDLITALVDQNSPELNQN